MSRSILIRVSSFFVTHQIREENKPHTPKCLFPFVNRSPLQRVLWVAVQVIRDRCGVRGGNKASLSYSLSSPGETNETTRMTFFLLLSLRGRWVILGKPLLVQEETSRGCLWEFWSNHLMLSMCRAGRHECKSLVSYELMLLLVSQERK